MCGTGLYFLLPEFIGKRIKTKKCISLKQFKANGVIVNESVNLDGKGRVSTRNSTLLLFRRSANLTLFYE
jgi:hypothetical protein